MINMSVFYITSLEMCPSNPEARKCVDFSIDYITETKSAPLDALLPLVLHCFTSRSIDQEISHCHQLHHCAGC